jgi:hypothetical protein
MINFELWNAVPTIYWLTVKIDSVPYGHIARNTELEDKYSLFIYRVKGSKIVNECIGKFCTVMEAKSAFLKQPIGDLVTVTSSC